MENASAFRVGPVPAADRCRDAKLVVVHRVPRGSHLPRLRQRSTEERKAPQSLAVAPDHDQERGDGHFAREIFPSHGGTVEHGVVNTTDLPHLVTHLTAASVIEAVIATAQRHLNLELDDGTL
jgi:hypothetical protein